MDASKSIHAKEKSGPKKRTKSALDDSQSEEKCEAPLEPEWFDVFDAMSLLNSMTRKVRTGPPAKPLSR
ncbi:hypothetical protein [Pseudomonas arsenicoxydans]|uniref:hypothetical protein n=1 Tax=Pseudomonas arsenicoxydans TaxID=702115 RepID=UPI00112AB74F|nr:hypothetical protein [Pseudomonas arsenicoxydans]